MPRCACPRSMHGLTNLYESEDGPWLTVAVLLQSVNMFRNMAIYQCYNLLHHCLHCLQLVFPVYLHQSVHVDTLYSCTMQCTLHGARLHCTRSTPHSLYKKAHFFADQSSHCFTLPLWSMEQQSSVLFMRI